MHRLMCGLIVCMLTAATVNAAEAKRPNFVFIYTDDQRWDAMSVVQKQQGDKGRFPWLKTPHMDRLAKEGYRFQNAFVVNALCAPSRATFLTGCYGHVNGVVNNHTPFPEKSITHASLLKTAGYKTAYIGKWHMGRQSGQRPGFDFSASFIGQGKYVDCPFEVNGKTTDTKGWVDDVGTDYGIQFIKDNKDKPFLLVLGFKATHGPFDPPERHKKTYEGEMARSTPNFKTPAIYKKDAKPPEDVPEKVQTNLNYFRCITAADDNLGRVLKALDDLKLADDTFVVFTSDNGYYLGEHGLGDKRSAYDESMRIPLLVRYPKLPRKNWGINGIVTNTDLAPTFLDYAGVPIPKEMQGRSWRPLLDDKNKIVDWREAFFYCYHYENNFNIPTVTAVRTASAKLIKYPGHDEWTELFDLLNDPYETKNLVKDPARANLLKDMEALYDKEAKAIAFRIPEFADDPNKATGSAPLKAWVLDYRFDKEGDKIADASKHKNDGTAKDVPLVDGRDGRKARKFDGKGHIDIAKSPSLNPAVAGWTIEIAFKAEKGDGVLMASGGVTNGWCVYLEDGKPVFTVTAGGAVSRIAGKQAVTGEWTKLTARITAERDLILTLDGKQAAKGKLPQFIRTEPRDALQVGADLGSKVVKDKMVPGFVGLIESVRVYSGEAP